MRRGALGRVGCGCSLCPWGEEWEFPPPAVTTGAAGPALCLQACEGAKIDSWHQILDPFCLIDCSVSLVILLQLQATEAFWLKSSWFKGENTG